MLELVNNNKWQLQLWYQANYLESSPKLILILGSNCRATAPKAHFILAREAKPTSHYGDDTHPEGELTTGSHSLMQGTCQR